MGNNLWVLSSDTFYNSSHGGKQYVYDASVFLNYTVESHRFQVQRMNMYGKRYSMLCSHNLAIEMVIVNKIQISASGTLRVWIRTWVYCLKVILFLLK